MKANISLSLCLLTALCMGAKYFTPKAQAAPFVADQNTLLLAHFDKTTQRADYAAGWSQFAGSGAALVDGYYGKAADLRGLQFDPNFLKTRNSYTPQFQYWGFWPVGNVDYRQGTLEFWFKTSPYDMKQNTLKNSLFFSGFAKNVVQNGELKSLAAWLTSSGINFTWPFLNNDVWRDTVRFRSVEGFKRDLQPDEWHHFAMCWSPGEMVMYIDGRPIAAHDMSGKFGLAFASYTHHSMAMNGIVMDELRISNIVRYDHDFEPNWRDGKRPDFAFTGVPNVKRFPIKAEASPLPAIVNTVVKGRSVPFKMGAFATTFDADTGYLTGLQVKGKTANRGENGLLLWRGVERTPLSKPRASNFKSTPKVLSFDQEFADNVRVSNRLTPHAGGVRWDVTFKNLTAKELWLEALLSVPLPLSGVKDYYDGSATHTQLQFPRRRDAYVSTLPFAAAADNVMSIGAGIDAHTPLSVLVSEWIPEKTTGTLRQGTRVVLDPKGQYSLTFYIVADKADFGTQNAIDGYHNLFPDLYKIRPDVPIYSYMGTSSDFDYMPFPDFARQCYVGGTWGHGPAHANGDEFGTAKYWNNPKYANDPSNAHTSRLEKIWGSLEQLRELARLRTRRNFDNAYTPRRSHYVPDLTPPYLALDIWPGYDPVGDPLVAAQYYMPNYLIVNEYHTPLGKRFKEQTQLYSKQMAPFSPGYINDMSHISPYRHIDPIARQSPGRAFSLDRGTYLVGAFGRQDRYEMINAQVINKYGQHDSIWSDGGLVSYMLCANSAAIAIEGGARHLYLTGPNEGVANARNLLGEKPLAVLNSVGDDALGTLFSPDDFTPKTLRDYYRYSDAQIMLFAIKNGVYLDPIYLMGNQKSMELNPILVESNVLGRKLLPGTRVQEPLWVRRAGNGLNSFLVVGNEEPETVTSDMTLLNSYFGGAPVLGAYFGDDVEQEISKDNSSVRHVAVQPRSVQAFKMLAYLDSEKPVQMRSHFTGDGLLMKSTFTMKNTAAARLQLNSFAPLYSISRITINGKEIPIGETISVSPGESTIVAEYHNRVLDFSQSDWQNVDLIKDNEANFYLVADKGISYDVGAPADPPFDLGYERGTAMMLNHFVEHYDDEDGIAGNLKLAKLDNVPPTNFNGWKVLLRIDPKLEYGRVRIDRATRSIYIEGQTRGEQRRAMMIFLRLIDRKYPSVGRHVPLRGPGGIFNTGHSEPWKRWDFKKETSAFFEKFSDPEWLDKPILEAAEEPLYANGNMDFAGKYTLQSSPYLFEPTYADNFIYGYSGPAAEPVEFPVIP